MKFTLKEKLAIVKAIDSMILADDIIHNGEINAFSELMDRIDFDSNFLVAARGINEEQGSQILHEMPDQKKKSLAVILEDVAKSDGFFHEKEKALLLNIFTAMGINRDPY